MALADTIEPASSLTAPAVGREHSFRHTIEPRNGSASAEVSVASASASTPEPSGQDVGETLFDLKFWLDNSKLFYRANRLGIGKLVPIWSLREVLRRLVRDGIVSDQDAQELVNDLQREGLLL